MSDNQLEKLYNGNPYGDASVETGNPVLCGAKTEVTSFLILKQVLVVNTTSVHHQTSSH